SLAGFRFPYSWQFLSIGNKHRTFPEDPKRMQPTRHPPSQQLMAFPRKLPNKLQPQPPPHHGTYGESVPEKANRPE
ncbi:MAG: hypothetical protein ACI36T_00410, partial [Eggerthellaceae bacterium]